MKLDEASVGSFLREMGGQEAGALALFGLDPSILGRLVDKASALLELGKHAQAESLLIDLANLAPRSGAMACLLAECRLTRGDVEGAHRTFSHAIELMKDADEHQLRSTAYLGRARALIEMNERDIARVDLEHVSKGDDPRLAELARGALRALEAEGDRS